LLRFLRRVDPAQLATPLYSPRSMLKLPLLLSLWVFVWHFVLRLSPSGVKELGRNLGAKTLFLTDKLKTAGDEGY